MKGYDKIKNILDYLHLNTLTFSKNIGVNAQQIYDIKSGKILNISARLSAKIVSRYPQININWLLTGEGEMLNGAPPTQTVRQTSTGGDNINAHNSTVSTSGDMSSMVIAQQKQVSDLMEMVRNQQETIARQQEQMSRLISIIEEKL